MPTGLTGYWQDNPDISRGSFLKNITPFSYNPSEADPELQLLRRRALGLQGQEHAGLTNEISRAGLLGSSASFGLLQGEQDSNARQLEDIDASTFARRRSEALDQYNRELDFRRQMEAGRYQGYMGQQEQNRSGLLAGLSGIGKFGGDLFSKWLAKYGAGALGAAGAAGGAGAGVDLLPELVLA